MVAATPVPKAAGEDNGTVVRVGIAEVGTVRPTSPGVGAGTAVVRGEVFVSEVIPTDVESDVATVVGSGVARALVAGWLVVGPGVGSTLVAGRLMADAGVPGRLVAGSGDATCVVDAPVGAESWVADARADGAVFDGDFAVGRALDLVIAGEVLAGNPTEAADDGADVIVDAAGALAAETAPADAGEAAGAGLPVHPATMHVTHTTNAPMAAR